MSMLGKKYTMSQMIKGKLRFGRVFSTFMLWGDWKTPIKTHTSLLLLTPHPPNLSKTLQVHLSTVLVSSSSFKTCKVTELSIFCVLYTHVLMSIADTTGVHPLYRTDFVYLLFLEIQNQKGITAVYNIITPTGRSGISSVTRNIIL